MYDFIRGPLVWVAFMVFAGGLVYQIFQFFSMTQRKERVFMPRGSQGLQGQSTGSIGQWVGFLRKTILGHHPVMTIVTSLFHVCLILTPIFLLAHSILFDESWRLTPWSFSETTTDVMTVIVLSCCAFFLLRRIFLRRVRAITTGYDYLILMIAAAPFVSGFLAYHQWFDYGTILIAHILAGELMLIVIPFTKLGHMLFFFLYRFFIGSEYSFGQGSRTW
jgi:nitrate reductase gamma subunit